ncbi:MAG: hypothetical protein UV70_C0008G0028 [Parcubacteria group bacterium GW2011_GWA2_43_13]|nr:MAG: hypothetical protein UV70_C0008G0028 [Parcubacteria group bacterium GW2011_GWA2_43_13]OGY69539.1 MAG: hypothetical protein A3B94_03785 [Candidatus Jacksonbacteria bacterium RIFCSPHIGHO2_02_FULL_43_10]OGY70256.1 MAG: hypothetical protein A2986_04295 [Candidatus Jacksonbacteria bacterium RIFCSPLOWO2_01_FULL_44_13]HAZ16976.1 hypothetical protein [Candidatus Jacksonbacteria bacterium]
MNTDVSDILDRSFTGVVSVVINQYNPVEVHLQQQPLIRAVDEAFRRIKGGMRVTLKEEWKEVAFDEATCPPKLSVSS